MKKLITICFSLTSFSSFAASEALQNLQGSEIDFSSQITVQKQLVLNNPFLIQLYTSFKAARVNDQKMNKLMELVFDHNYGDALKLFPEVSFSEAPRLKDGVELYLLFQNGLVQNFIGRWIEVSSDQQFLKTEIGLALDQVVAKGATELIMINGLTLDESLVKKATSLKDFQSKFNYSLQAYLALRSGENALSWIGKLDIYDPLRMPLAQTAMLSFAKQGKLGASGKLVKEVMEPILDRSIEEEEIAQYFITLGRLLYQANAMEEAKKYYDLIPESSRYFLKARSESLWIHIRERDFARTKGELATLEHKIFRDQFYPEAYVVSGMANVLLCQFVEARHSINNFVESNKFWVKEIVNNLKSSEPQVIDQNQFITNFDRLIQSIDREKGLIENRQFPKIYLGRLSKLSELAINHRRDAIHGQWKNRQKVLETALYKMNFVKIELISRMRQMALNQNIENADVVSHYQAATAKGNQLKFPNDGVVWSDDLFNMTADVTNKCIKGNWK